MKVSTLTIQEFLVNLGEKLGFDAERESSIEKMNMDYLPVHDVVWWLDVSERVNLEKLRPLFAESPEWFERMRRIPFAVFEIEGSTTSSKNQVGNGANLYACTGIFKFMIVDNGGAAKENDTYRRGVKIVRYFQAHWGDRNLALFDWHHLEQSINGLAISSITQPASQPTSQLNRSGFGGETTSIPIFNFISQCLIESGLTCKQNHVPDGIMEEAEIFHLLKERIEIRDPEAAIYTGKAFRRTPESKHLDICRSVRDCRYLPRLDLVAGFHAPRSFHQWLQRLASLLREDVANYSFLFAQQGREQSRFVNLISVEIETTISKHAHGGILNIANHSYCGIWAAPSLAKSHLKFMKNRFGLQNVVYFPVDQWIKKG